MRIVLLATMVVVATSCADEKDAFAAVEARGVVEVNLGPDGSAYKFTGARPYPDLGNVPVRGRVECGLTDCDVVDLGIICEEIEQRRFDTARNPFALARDAEKLAKGEDPETRDSIELLFLMEAASKRQACAKLNLADCTTDECRGREEARQAAGLTMWKRVRALQDAQRAGR